MRYFEIQSGMRMPISSEERALLDHLGDHPVSSQSLDARQQELARLMLSRGLLNRVNKNDQTYYKINSVNDIWRGQDDS
jgi:hypothetical protein